MLDDLLEDSEFRFLFLLVFFTMILIIIHYSILYEWFKQRIFLGLVCLIIATPLWFLMRYIDQRMQDTSGWEDE